MGTQISGRYSMRRAMGEQPLSHMIITDEKEERKSGRREVERDRMGGEMEG